MNTAEEMRNLAYKANTPDISDILEKIKLSARDGKYYLNINTLSSDEVRSLEGHGFKVTFKESRHYYYEISWEEASVNPCFPE